MTKPKNTEELAVMIEGGAKLAKIREELLSASVEGVQLIDIENIAQKRIVQEGGVASFASVRNYKWATCLCVNDQVVHGIPSSYILKNGDLLTIDVGMIYGGFHTDTASTIVIGGEKSAGPDILRFLDTGKQTLVKAIDVSIAGNRIGNISKVIGTEISKAGYSVVTALTGHSIGKKLHEDPMIPGYLDRPIERTPLLVRGMTIAIEVIYAMGNGDIAYSNHDGWTLSSRDGSMTAVFEHTVAVGESKSTVLTAER